MPSAHSVKLRPLEREDLRYVHQLDNNASVMRYWFEEPYEAFVELSDLYDKHIHDQSERRFVVECDGEKAGLVELVEINHVQGVCSCEKRLRQMARLRDDGCTLRKRQAHLL